MTWVFSQQLSPKSVLFPSSSIWPAVNNKDKYASLEQKNELKMHSKCDFDYKSGRATIQQWFLVKRLFLCSAAVSILCVVCKFVTIFSNIMLCLHPTIKNVIISGSRLMRLTMLHWTCVGTPLSCDYVVNSLLGTFTTNYTNFWQTLKKPTNYIWSTCASKQISNKSVSCVIEYS